MIDPEEALEPHIAKFIVVVESKQVIIGRGDKKTIETEKGQEFLAPEQDGGWVEAFPSEWPCSEERIYEKAKKFSSVEEAVGFWERWDNYLKKYCRWCEPNGKYKIIEIEPVYELCLKGYKLKNTIKNVRKRKSKGVQK